MHGAVLLSNANQPPNGDAFSVIEFAPMIGFEKDAQTAMFWPLAYVRATDGRKAIDAFPPMGPDGITSNGLVTITLAPAGRLQARRLVRRWRQTIDQAAAMADRWINPFSIVEQGMELLAEDARGEPATDAASLALDGLWEDSRSRLGG